jgi:predicted enzyme related to lactoylglutathione lyase
VERAKRFYRNTIGWSFQSTSTPDGQTYWLAMLGERPVAGIYSIAAPEFDGMPECWMPYLAVDDVDKRVTKAVKAGAKLMKPIFDIPDVGRITVWPAGRRRRSAGSPRSATKWRKDNRHETLLPETLNPRKACAVAKVPRLTRRLCAACRSDQGRAQAARLPGHQSATAKFPPSPTVTQSFGKPTPSWPISRRWRGLSLFPKDNRQIELMRWLRLELAALHASCR